MYDYGYSDVADTSLITGMLGSMFGMMIFSAIIGLIAIISYAKIFKKAGKPWWASIIPIYNTIVMLEIAKLPIWYIALFFVPIANIYVLFKINIEMAKKFGKSTGFGVGMTLLSIIFVPLLAFSDNKYEDDVQTTLTNQQFDATNVINGQSNENINDSSNINTVPVAPIIPVQSETSQINDGIQQPNNTEITTDAMQNVNPAMEPTNVAPVEPAPAFNTMPSVEPVVESTPVMEPTNIAPVEPAPAFNTMPSVEPVVESTPVMEPTNVAPVESAPAFNTMPSVEPVVESAPVVEPTNVAPVEPAPAFNTMPSVEPVVESTPVMEPTNVAPVESAPAFNTMPSVEPVVESTPVNEQAMVANEIPIQPVVGNNISDLDKKCKNCGSVMPDIVSICPNCGTDNE